VHISLHSTDGKSTERRSIGLTHGGRCWLRINVGQFVRSRVARIIISFHFHRTVDNSRVLLLLLLLLLFPVLLLLLWLLVIIIIIILDHIVIILLLFFTQGK